MVKHLEHAFGLFSRYSVIQRRHHIFQQHEDAVHQCSKQMQAAARTNSRNNAERDGGDGQQRTNAVGYRVGNLFSQRLGANGLAGIAHASAIFLLFMFGAFRVPRITLLELAGCPFP